MTVILALLSIALIVPPITGLVLGQGKSSSQFIEALNFQPRAHSALQRMLLISLAILETGGILSLVIWGMLLQRGISTTLEGISFTGVIFALAIPASVTSIRSYIPIQEALMAVARQPRLTQSVTNLLLLLLSFIQTPLIFGTIVSWFIISQDAAASIPDMLRLIAAGATLGFGCIGPVIGLTRFAGQAFHSIGRHYASYNDIVSFTFMSQAIIETPILFALIISLFLLFVITPEPTAIHAGLTYILAALCITGTTLGAGLSSSRTAVATCKSIPHHPQSYRALVRTSMLAQTLIDTVAIYGLIIGCYFLFV